MLNKNIWCYNILYYLFIGEINKNEKVKLTTVILAVLTGAFVAPMISGAEDPWSDIYILYNPEKIENSHSISDAATSENAKQQEEFYAEAWESAATSNNNDSWNTGTADDVKQNEDGHNDAWEDAVKEDTSKT